MSGSVLNNSAERALANERRSRCRISGLIVGLYRVRTLRGLCIRVAERLEGGRLFSATLRDLLLRYHGVKVGRYTYGPCLEPGALPRGTIVGAYCSIASGLKVLRRNHPVDAPTQHPFFYNRDLGLVRQDTIPAVEDNPLIVGADVWIGDRVTILPNCRSIGHGAVVGAGAIVTRNVEPYSVVAGNPARLIGTRFSPEVRRFLDSTKWWELPISELVEFYPKLARKVRLMSETAYGDKNHESGSSWQFFESEDRDAL